MLSAFQELRDRGVRFVTNATTGFHIHIGFGTEIMPLGTAKSVLQLCTGFEDRLDALYSTSRIDENAVTNVAPGNHFKNNEKTELGPNIFHWLIPVEEASSFEETSAFFCNDIPDCRRKTNAHYSTLNLDNLWASPYGKDFGDPISTIDFRQHSGTLD